MCNDSHGDATLAFCDPDFDLIGVLDKSNRIITKDLDLYFKRPKNQSIDLKLVKEKMKGLKYQVMAENYIFEKIKEDL